MYWVFVIGPVATDGSLPPATRLVTTGYPATGVVLFAVVLPRRTHSGQHLSRRVGDPPGEDLRLGRKVV